VTERAAERFRQWFSDSEFYQLNNIEMGINIYAEWKGRTEQELDAQRDVFLHVDKGGIGYLREAYHGEPYATKYLFSETFDSKEGEAPIPVAVLESRLSHTLDLVAERERSIYQSSEKHIQKVQQSFLDFVALCKRKEAVTGEPVIIYALF
jgi:hypothetical protein